ncbi:MAG: hypothetical protein IPN59_13395 [Holophaga sp.]|nr:hypothetical protein [Holophaga sp.]
MHKKLLNLMVFVLVFSMLLAACAAPATEAPAANEEPAAANPAAPTEKTIVIGFTASQTGAQEVSSKRQVNGFNLWMKQVNDTASS